MAKKMRPKSVVISNKVESHGNDPLVIKKAKDSKVFLEKHGFPKGLISSSQKNAKAKGKI